MICIFLKDDCSCLSKTPQVISMPFVCHSNFKSLKPVCSHFQDSASRKWHWSHQWECFLKKKLQGTEARFPKALYNCMRRCWHNYKIIRKNFVLPRLVNFKVFRDGAKATVPQSLPEIGTLKWNFHISISFYIYMEPYWVSVSEILHLYGTASINEKLLKR